MHVEIVRTLEGLPILISVLWVVRYIATQHTDDGPLEAYNLAIRMGVEHRGEGIRDAWDRGSILVHLTCELWTFIG